MKTGPQVSDGPIIDQELQRVNALLVIRGTARKAEPIAARGASFSYAVLTPPLRHCARWRPSWQKGRR